MAVGVGYLSVPIVNYQLRILVSTDLSAPLFSLPFCVEMA